MMLGLSTIGGASGRRIDDLFALWCWPGARIVAWQRVLVSTQTSADRRRGRKPILTIMPYLDARLVFAKSMAFTRLVDS